jgi:histidinol-phosphate/aromatic aminotransferase/cobyric acid decarboxylase-like protein
MSDRCIPPAGPHGGDGAAIARALGVPVDQIVDLSASLNPFAPDVAGLAASLGSSLVAYPDPTGATAALADAMSVDAERLVLTNGGSEAIALVARILGDGVVDDPEFSLYRRHLRTGDDPTGGRWRSNPSSPLGTLADVGDTAAVWDEAFWPMTTGTWTRGDDASWRLGSLTKLWACAGLRIGYVIAPDRAGAARIRDEQPAWSVNGLALAMVVELLAGEDLRATADRIAAYRRRFARAVEDLGHVVAPGVAPWLLVHDTPGLREALAPCGVVVRDCSSFGLPGTHRIGLPRERDLDRVLSALESALDRDNGG